MRTAGVAALLIVVAGLGLAPSRAQDLVRPDAGALFAAYASGQFDLPSRAIRTYDDWSRLEDGVARLSRTWKDQASDRRGPVWEAARVAFLVDVARVVASLDVNDAADILETVRDLAALRPGLPGDSDGPIDRWDRFEVAVHRMSLSTLFSASGHARRYLGAIAPRLAAFRRSDAGRRLISRIEIAPFLMAEAASRPFTRDEASRVSSFLSTFRGLGQTSATSAVPPNEQLRLELSRALDLMPPAANLSDDVGAEMEIRRGLILYRMQRNGEALDALAAGLAGTTEAAARHWGLLFRGRVLERMGQADAAIAAYDEAVRVVWPRAQTAAVALAAAHFLRGDREQADRWSRLARTATAGDDPWWEYWYGDQRFARALLTEIRISGS